MATDHLIDWMIVVIAFMVLPVGSLLTGRAIARDSARHTMLRRYRWIILRGLIVLALVVMNWLWAGRSFAALGMDLRMNPAVLAGFAVDLLLVANAAMLFFGRAIPAEKQAALRAKLNESRIIPRTRPEFRLFPLVILVGSTAEEILYRGFLIWFFAPAMGAIGAVLLSSLAFGLAHAYQGRSGVMRTMLIGLLFGIGFVLTHNLWWLILAHVAVNLTGYLLACKLGIGETGRDRARTSDDTVDVMRV